MSSNHVSKFAVKFWHPFIRATLTKRSWLTLQHVTDCNLYSARLPILLLCAAPLIFSQALSEASEANAINKWLYGENRLAQFGKGSVVESFQPQRWAGEIRFQFRNSGEKSIFTIAPALQPGQDISNRASSGSADKPTNDRGVQFITHPIYLLVFFATFLIGNLLFFWAVSFTPIERAFDSVLFFLFDGVPRFFRFPLLRTRVRR